MFLRLGGVSAKRYESTPIVQGYPPGHPCTCLSLREAGPVSLITLYMNPSSNALPKVWESLMKQCILAREI